VCVRSVFCVDLHRIYHIRVDELTRVGAEREKNGPVYIVVCALISLTSRVATAPFSTAQLQYQ
jgi:hypothetical protein